MPRFCRAVEREHVESILDLMRMSVCLQTFAGMMVEDTVLNLGLNDQTVEALAKQEARFSRTLECAYTWAHG